MDMQTIVNQNLLRYAVGRAITCPRCNQVLDVARAVNVGHATGSKTTCATCFDAAVAAVSPDLSRYEVLDGRVLFPARVATQTVPAVPRPGAVKQADVRVGASYVITHGGRDTRVTVLYARTHQHLNTRSGLTPPKRVYWVCRNERTKREITVKSATKFRAEVAK